jgi:hypothetical protein
MSDQAVPIEPLAQTTLVDALLARRSLRFGLGMHLNGWNSARKIDPP